MAISSDWELLDQFVSTRCQDAFAQLVRRHVDAVYATALRSLGSPGQQAHDVTQAVFLLLWQKASKIPRRGALAGWLFRATRYCCDNVRKSEGRRRQHEREAAMERPEATTPPVHDESEPLRAMLDGALERLGEGERQAILVRYLQAKSLSETGEILAVAPRTLEKRLERGLAKLRRIIARKGLLASGAAVIGVMVAESAKAAPAALAAAASNPAVGSGASVVSIAKGAAIMMTWMKLQVAAAVVCAVVVPAAAVLVTAAYAADPAAGKAADLPFTVGKETTGITEPLHADGTPDYVKALNEKYGKGVTPENNAFVAWLKVVGTGKEVLPSQTREEFLKTCGAGDWEGMKWVQYGALLKSHGLTDEAANDALDDPMKASRQLWTPADFPFLADYLKENEAVFDAVKEAFARPRYWLPAVSQDGRSAVYVLLPSLGKMRMMADGLSARATLRAKSEDFGGFLSDVLAVKQMAWHIGSGSEPIERFVAVAIDAQADRAIGAVSGAGVLSAAQCDKLAKALDSLEPLPSMWEAVDVERRWEWLDATVLIAMGVPEPAQAMEPDFGQEKKDPKQLLANIQRDFVDWDVVLTEVNHVADEELAIIKKPRLEDMEDAVRGLVEGLKVGVDPVITARSGFARADGETREAYTKRVALALARRLSSSDWRAEALYRESVMQDGMARALVAAAKFHAEKGAWPERLEDLVPAYLKELPKDIYRPGGKSAVVYTVTKEGVRVYSIGRNRVDDHGRRGGGKGDDITLGVLGP